MYQSATTDEGGNLAPQKKQKSKVEKQETEAKAIK